MSVDKTLLAGSTATLILKLLDEQDMYGYQMIEELARRSDDTFQMKAGTLYPLLHSLEKKEFLESYEQNTDSNQNRNRTRKYYRLTNKGRKHLQEKTAEWQVYSSAVSKILKGGLGLACECF